MIEQASEPPAEEALIHRRLHAQVRHALGQLDGREREVLELRFGLDRDGDPRTLQEVGELLGLTRERIARSSRVRKTSCAGRSAPESFDRT